MNKEQLTVKAITSQLEAVIQSLKPLEVLQAKARQIESAGSVDPITSTADLGELIQSAMFDTDVSMRKMHEETGIAMSMIALLRSGEAKGVTELFAVMDYLGVTLCTKK